PSLSETTFARHKEMKKHADNLASKLDVSVRYADKSDLPVRHKKAKGKFDVTSGVVTIYLDNNNGVTDIESTFLHEVVAHKGVRELFGDKYTEFIADVYKSLDANTKAAVNALATKRGFDIGVAMDEYLAELAEQGVRNPNVWQRVKEAFMRMLNKAGISLKREIGDGDLRYILWRSYKNLQNKKSMLDIAEDIAISNRFRADESDPKQINERFNRELEAQVEGTLPKGHIYSLGKPSAILESAGVPMLDIELSSSILHTKASDGYINSHPFDLSGIKNLPNAINAPIAVFDSKTQFSSKVILTELKNNNHNVIVAMKVNASPQGYNKHIVINSIRSIYPKDNIKDVINWINRGDLLLYIDKNKILEWITQQQSNSADVAIPYKDFNVATNIIQNFENPK
ncbi:MAG: hypothetical protein RSB93_06205, partial [Rikenellaceae bacterium]